MKKEIKELEAKIDVLLSRAQRQSQALQSAQAAEISLSEERNLLEQKNELAKSKIEAMLNRLKNLEKA